VVAKGKKPDAKFNATDYDRQAGELQAKYDEAKIDADKQQLEATKMEGRYNQLVQKWQMTQSQTQQPAPQ
jgi:ABC-type amino acid transport substrate-binding protein